jgi:tetratricopeptide (TPR) repeat protein
MTLLGHLSTLETAGLIRIASAEPELEYLFRHPLIREAAYASLLSTDRKRLHQAVGEVTERIYPDQVTSRDLAATLARHFEVAEDAVRALKYYRLAGEAALASFANDEAGSHFRRALGLAENPKERAQLLTSLGEALFGQSRYTEAIETWQEGITHYQTLGSEGVDGVARLYARSARAAWNTGDKPGGLRICEQGLEAIANAPESPAIALLIHEAGRAYHFNGFNDQALTHCQQALDMAERLNAIEVQADALATYGVLSDLPHEEALEALRNAVMLAEGAGLLAIAHRAHNNLGAMSSQLLGDEHQARAHFICAAELAAQRGSPYEELFALNNVAATSFELGKMTDLKEAVQRIDDIISTMLEPESARIRTLPLKGMLLVPDGKWDEILTLVRTHYQEIREQAGVYEGISAAVLVGEILLEMHRIGDIDSVDEAEAFFTEALEMSDQASAVQVYPRCQLSIVRSRQARYEEARRLLTEARHLSEPQTTIWDEVNLKSAEAELAVAEERWADALVLYEEVAGIEAKLGRRFYWARIIELWADVHLARGEPADLQRAQALLRESLSALEDMEFPYFVTRVSNKLHDLRNKLHAQALAHQQISEEMAQAAKIQESFLPEELPQIPGWRVSAILEPARETSGDYYDFIPLPDRHLGIVVADVADKGAAAALYMASSRTLIRTYASEHPNEPELVLSQVNQRILGETHAGLFVTVFYAILDPATGKVTYCNAGHNPPLHFSVDKDHQVASLQKTGLALGIIEEGAWERGEIELKSGESLVIYTDGLTDAQNAKKTMFGEEPGDLHRRADRCTERQKDDVRRRTACRDRAIYSRHACD